MRRGLLQIRLGAIFAACCIGCAPLPKSSLLGSQSDVSGRRDFYALRSEIKSDLKNLRRELGGLGAGEKPLETIHRLRNNYRALGRTTPPKGDGQLLAQYCEVTLGILTDLETQMQRFYKEAQANSLGRLQKMDSDLAGEFAPGPWQRFLAWFRR